jgi:hypothetical protein
VAGEGNNYGLLNLAQLEFLLQRLAPLAQLRFLSFDLSEFVYAKALAKRAISKALKDWDRADQKLPRI